MQYVRKKTLIESRDLDLRATATVQLKIQAPQIKCKGPDLRATARDALRSYQPGMHSSVPV